MDGGRAEGAGQAAEGCRPGSVWPAAAVTWAVAGGERVMGDLGRVRCL